MGALAETNRRSHDLAQEELQNQNVESLEFGCAVNSSIVGLKISVLK